MELKKYQSQVISDLNRYCELVNETASVSKAYNAFWNEQNVNVGFGGLPSYNNIVENTPHVCFKVPTGGGKTFLACNSLRVIFGNMPSKKTKLVVWLVPSEAILTQTIATLSNPSHPYRQKIEADFNGRVQVYDKRQVLDGQQFNPTTVGEQLSIVVMSFDSFRIRNKEGRKVYQENANLYQFAKFSSSPETKIEGVDDTALIQVFNQLSPVVIVDESHHTTGELSVEMLKNLNPSFILDLTATPRKNSNIIAYVDAKQLKDENMVKLPVIVYNRPSQEEVVADAIDLRNKLDELAIASFNAGGEYIRPIVLFQAQPKQAENKETFEKLKERLIGLGIPKEEIAIKTAEINDLKNEDLLSSESKIKYIITINALKEGWDCPFAYILATLANKTSTVDVEQILGRILRLPYTRQHSSKFLNLSYVLTSSNDFHATIDKIVSGLNDAGFSEQDYRVAAHETEAANSPQTAPVQNTMDLSEEEEFLAFDDTVVKSVLESRQESSGAETSAIAEMLSNAAEKSDSYDEAIRASEYEAVGNLPLEVRNKVNVYGMYEQFREDALAIKLPQFFVKAKPSLFTLMEEDCKDLLHTDTLADGFTLTDKSAEIDFQSATENVVEIDVNKNERPKMRLLSDAESEYFKEMMQSLPPESRIRNCKLKIKSMLEKLDFIDSRDLTAYIDRVVDNMDSDTLASLEKNVVGFAERIKKKINALLNNYKKVQFEKQLATGKIYCLPSFQLKKEIAPLNTFSLLSKSLYTSEGSMNDFERKVIEKVSSLPNVKWWHRNIDRLEFAINGFINHYPDFIVLTGSGKIVIIETKGDYLVTNDDSKDKAELGKTWQAQAGTNYRYFMVYEGDASNNKNAIQYDAFLEIMREL